MSLTPTLSVTSDAEAIALRYEDAREASLYSPLGPRHALAQSIGNCPGTITYRNAEGHIVGILGISRSHLGVSPWLICSPLAKAHRHAVFVKAAEVVEGLQTEANEGALVYNYVGKESVDNRTFLTQLGFRIIPAPAGPFDLFYLPPNVS